MDVLMLSRLQFVAATFFHFLFVPPYLGLSVLIAIMETVYVRTGDEEYRPMARFWGKIFIINFAVGVVGLYPNLLPSSLKPAYSLAAFNSASSPLTLKIMLGVALTFLPLVILYQVWVHFLFKEKVKEEHLMAEEGY